MQEEQWKRKIQEKEALQTLRTPGKVREHSSRCETPSVGVRSLLDPDGYNRFSESRGIISCDRDMILGFREGHQGSLVD